MACLPQPCLLSEGICRQIVPRQERVPYDRPVHQCVSIRLIEVISLEQINVPWSGDGVLLNSIFGAVEQQNRHRNQTIWSVQRRFVSSTLLWFPKASQGRVLSSSSSAAKICADRPMECSRAKAMRPARLGLSAGSMSACEIA